MNQQPEDSNEPAGSPGIPLAGQQPVGCQPSLEELYNYMDGYMDEQRQAAVRTHLSNCGGCEEFYHFQASFRHLIGKRCRTELPEDLSKRIFQSIYDQP